MGKAAKALELISSEVANVSQECFVQATNIFNLKLKAKNEVNISGLTVNANMKNAVSSCSSTTGIESGPMHAGLGRALNAIKPKETDNTILDALGAYNGYSTRINMHSTIRDNVNIDVVNRCLAVSLNSVVIQATSSNNINLQNVTIEQTAKSELQECLAAVDIKIGNTTQSLQQFFERNEDQYEVDGYGCVGFEGAKNTLIYGTVGIYIVVIAIVAYIVIRRYLKRKNSGKL